MEKISQPIGSLFNAVFRPSQFVRAPDAVTQTSVWGSLDRTKSLLAVFLINVVLYATPLTLSGYGVAVESQAPTWFGPVAGAVLGNPDTVWWLVAGIAQNSAFLIALSGVTLLTYHLALVLTRSSNGFVLTLHTVVYSVSAYLAGIFTVLVFLSQNSAYATARTLVANLQIRFITVFYDLFEVPPSERVFTVSESVAAGQLTDAEAGIVAALITLVLYFGYSMYLGARLNHGTGVTGAVLAVLAVGLSPAIYVTVLLVYSTGGLSI